MSVLSKDYNKERNFIVNLFNKRFITLCLIAFLLGRGGILQGLTPFGIGYFAALKKKEKKYTLVGVSTFLGIVSNQGIYNSIPYGIALMMIYFLYQYVIDLREAGTFKLAFISGFTYFTTAMIIASLKTFYLYDVMMIGFEALVIFVMVYITSYSLPLIIEHKNRGILSTEEIICAALLMALAISGINEVYIFNISLRNSLAILITLLFAYNGGSAIGASVGVTLGLITSMSIANTPPVVIGIFAFSGLLAGIFKDMGKSGSALGFFMGTGILTFYINGYYEIFIQFKEIFLAAIAFLSMPTPWIQELEKFCNSPRSLIHSNNSHSERVNKLAQKRLGEFSNVFYELATTFDKISDRYEIFERDDLTDLIQEVCNYACSNCGMRRGCWEKNLHATYRDMSDLLLLIETQGPINTNDFPKELRKRCIHPKRVLEKMTHLYELSYLDMTWKQRFVEGRELIGEQFKGVSKVIGEIVKSLEQDTTFDVDLENQMYVELDKAGLSVKNIMAARDLDGHLEITIEKNPCYCRDSCTNQFAPVLSQVVGTSLVKKPGICSYQRDGAGCSFTLVEGNRYHAVTKVAQVNKDGNVLSGDNYTFMDINDHQYLMALSDGMGTGQEAYHQSNATITMLEKMMEVGMDREVTIRTINNMLMLKSSEEIFSSLDMVLLNLCNGGAEFTKIGATPGYIKRNHKEVINIKASNLPIGIVKDIEYKEELEKIEDGDFIILVSDGILDVNKGEEKDWLPSFIASMNTHNPQDLADKILDQALKLSENKVEDDMTVLVTKVWRKVS